MSKQFIKQELTEAKNTNDIKKAEERLGSKLKQELAEADNKGLVKAAQPLVPGTDLEAMADFNKKLTELASEPWHPILVTSLSLRPALSAYLAASYRLVRLTIIYIDAESCSYRTRYSDSQFFKNYCKAQNAAKVDTMC